MQAGQGRAAQVPGLQRPDPFTTEDVITPMDGGGDWFIRGSENAPNNHDHASPGDASRERDVTVRSRDDRLIRSASEVYAAMARGVRSRGRLEGAGDGGRPQWSLPNRGRRGRSSAPQRACQDEES